MRSARGPAPSSSIASRFSAQASDPGPYRPRASGRPTRRRVELIPADDMSEGSGMRRWGADFDPDRLASLETAMWKAYYRRQPARLFGLLVRGLHDQARVSWPRALAAGLCLTKGAAGFARSSGDYDRFAPDLARAYRLLGLPDHVDAE